MRNWLLPSNLLQVSIAMMAPRGRAGNEGLALWLGRESDGFARVTHALELRGPGFRSSPLQLSISMLGMSAITDLADEKGVFLLGQVHSHPGGYIELSDTDRRYGIRIADYLSVVCPHYAQAPATRFADCGVHVFDGDDYRPLATPEVARRISFVTEPVVSLTLEVPK